MTGIGAIATSPAISALIAAALYIATYLSFLRLLRYPRNWNLPTLPASLTTAGLAAVMVAQVAVSPDGLDLVALVVSAGFVAGRPRWLRTAHTLEEGVASPIRTARPGFMESSSS